MWNTLDRPLVLASDSPRRKYILAGMGLGFTTCTPRIDNESSFFGERTIAESVQALALAKARSVSSAGSRQLVLAGDTVVCLGGVVLGKPASRDDARAMLRRLSARTHEVHTGVALVCRAAGFEHTGRARTNVRFRNLSDEEIEAYLDTREYEDKAGAYGIQGAALCFVESIDGCYYNVVGLPVAQTIRLFEAYHHRKDHSNA